MVDRLVLVERAGSNSVLSLTVFAEVPIDVLLSGIYQDADGREGR